MNDQLKKSKIDRFLKDEVMAGCVYDVLLKTFTKQRETKDVNVLAAYQIATYLLQESWKELSKFSSESQEISTKGQQIGL